MSIADLQARAAAHAAEAKAKAAIRRAQHPEFAEFVDRMKATFPGTRLVYVRWPDGETQGTARPQGVLMTLAPKKAEPKPAARRADPATSHQAADAARTFAHDHHGRILQALDRPRTCYGIAELTGLDHVAVARRMAELRASGAAKESGRTAPGPNGRQCTVWERV